MHFLSDIRFYGFTVFGFWMPIIFWSGYALITVGRDHKSGLGLPLLDAVLMCVAGILTTMFVIRDVRVGLADAVNISVIPLYFLFFRKRVGYMQIAGVTYLAELVSDVFGCPFMNDLHAGWLPQLLLNHTYHPVLSDYQCIGGSGLLDALVLGPLDAVFIVFIARVMLAYIQTYMSSRTYSCPRGGLSGR